MKALKKSFILVLYFCTLILILYSCKRNCPPEVKTATVSQITTTSAVSGGEVTDDCGSDVISRGVCWNTTGDPEINDSRTTDGTGTGTFTSNITGLTANTPYYVRAYATNEEGTGYGEEITFTSGEVTLATITTVAVNQITTTTAVSGGTITSNGGGALTEMGVCWTTEKDTPPTADGDHTTDTGTDSFVSNLESLVQGTTYYLRAYAKNSAGTAYGEILMFTTDVLDIDGNSYNALSIGDQIWLTENLKTTKLNDGTEMTNATDNAAWAALTVPGYCWFSNSITNKDIYGGLYNWYAVNTAKLCPAGWHVPSDTEWTTLTDFLGGESVAGGKLKETGTSHWNDPNTDASNSSGFSALPGGYRNFDGTFGGATGNGNWRSSTPDGSNPGFAWYRYIYNYAGNIYRGSGNNEGGFSVRCVKD